MNVSCHSVGMTLHSSSNKLLQQLSFGSMHGTAVPPAVYAEDFTCYIQLTLLGSPTTSRKGMYLIIGKNSIRILCVPLPAHTALI